MDNVEKLFWNNIEVCCLYDVLCGGQATEKLRQQLLEREKQRRRKQQQQDQQQQKNYQQQDQRQCKQEQCPSEPKEQEREQLPEQKEQELEQRLSRIADCHLQVPAEDAGASKELLLPPTRLLQTSSSLPAQPLTLPSACASTRGGGWAPVVTVCYCEVKVSTV